MAAMGSLPHIQWLSYLTVFAVITLTLANINFRGDRYVQNFNRIVVEEESGTMVMDDTEEIYNDDWDTLLLPALERHRRAADEKVDKCFDQETKNLGALSAGQSIHHTFSFDNDSNHGLALTWCEESGYGSMIVVTTEQIESLFQSVIVKPSVVYRTTDGGKSFTNISNLVGNAYIKKSNGLQRNPHESKCVYLVAHSPDSKVYKMYSTQDGGGTFKEHSVPFNTEESFQFHPEDIYPFHLLARSSAKSLYASFDNGASWNKIGDDVHDFKWGSRASETQDQSYIGRTLYFLESSNSGGGKWWEAIVNPTKFYKLKKTADGGKTFVTIIDKALSFGLEDKFIYASVAAEKEKERIMKVSSDGGKTWEETLLPTIIDDQFYSILDSSEGMVFMHVDNPGDTGHGTLYTSAGKGIIYSESLQKHLYPNFGQKTDFYKVESIRGVYIASQMSDDDSIHTRISYDRGGEWKPITRPEGVPCKDESKVCSLQLHNTYSISRGVAATGPLSVKTAPGIILAHGHVSDSLQTTPPDVFITVDGGYTWTKTLDGPHHYQIGDRGGLLLAVPINNDKTATYLKFSLDLGECWHTYNFTAEPIILTGLLTAPGSKSLNIGLWGFGNKDKVWIVHAIDFNDLITTECTKDDYQRFFAHSTLRKDENKNVEGCLLGMKESFVTVKKYSWCKKGDTYDQQKHQTVCVCTREDYECDFGYFRPDGSDLCTEEPEFTKKNIDICRRGHVEEIVTKGYRNIPGDKCKGGDVILPGQIINLKETCKPGEKVIIKEEVKPSYIKEVLEEPEVETTAQPTSSKKRFLIVAAISVVLVGLVGIVTLFFVCRYYALRKHMVTYRYSLLNQTEEQDFDADLEQVLTSEKTVYEDSDEEERTSNRPSMPNGRSATSSSSSFTTRPLQNLPTVASYHDDSDVDMLE